MAHTGEKISYFDKEKKLPAKKNFNFAKTNGDVNSQFGFKWKALSFLAERSLPSFKFPLLIIDHLKGHAHTWRVENVRHFFFEPVPFVFS